MKPLLFLLLLPFLSACSNASGNKDKKADSAKAAPSPAEAPANPTSAKDGPSSTPTQPDSTMPAPGAWPGESHAQTSLRIAMESTLTSGDISISIPPFGLDNVMAAIRQMQVANDSGDADIEFKIALSNGAYNALSFDEKFTYNMIHAEYESQMCDALPEHKDEGNRIYGQTVNYFGEFGWSERQLSFFKDNRDSVEQLIKATINQQGKIGMNFLDVIKDINATDMIPFLINAYRKDNSNHYVLTTLMLLMNENNYPEFMQSTSHKKLYDDDAETYTAFLIYNKANEDLIIRRATNFYHDTVRN
jgi:hypothetical protein